MVPQYEIPKNKPYFTICDLHFSGGCVQRANSLRMWMTKAKVQTQAQQSYANVSFLIVQRIGIPSTIPKKSGIEFERFRMTAIKFNFGFGKERQYH